MCVEFQKTFKDAIVQICFCPISADKNIGNLFILISKCENNTKTCAENFIILKLESEYKVCM